MAASKVRKATARPLRTRPVQMTALERLSAADMLDGLCDLSFIGGFSCCNLSSREPLRSVTYNASTNWRRPCDLAQCLFPAVDARMRRWPTRSLRPGGHHPLHQQSLHPARREAIHEHNGLVPDFGDDARTALHSIRSASDQDEVRLLFSEKRRELHPESARRARDQRPLAPDRIHDALVVR